VPLLLSQQLQLTNCCFILYFPVQFLFSVRVVLIVVVLTQKRCRDKEDAAHRRSLDIMLQARKQKITDNQAAEDDMTPDYDSGSDSVLEEPVPEAEADKDGIVDSVVDDEVDTDCVDAGVAIKPEETEGISVKTEPKTRKPQKPRSVIDPNNRATFVPCPVDGCKQLFSLAKGVPVHSKSLSSATILFVLVTVAATDEWDDVESFRCCFSKLIELA
jgi:hypothetical protein